MWRKLIENRDVKEDFSSVADDSPLIPNRILRLYARRKPVKWTNEEWRITSKITSRGVTVTALLSEDDFEDEESPDPLIPIPRPCPDPHTAGTRCWLSRTALKKDPNGIAETVSEGIGRQYGGLSSRILFKHACNPSRADIAKLLRSERNKAKTDRLLVHYCGYGVPKPKETGELFFLRNQVVDYMPVSLPEILRWTTGGPSIFVIEADNAGAVVQAELDRNPGGGIDTETGEIPLIILASCKKGQRMPRLAKNETLPADLFTCCLTTPVRTIASLHRLTRNATHFTSIIEKQLDRKAELLEDFNGVYDRRTSSGELYWIFVSIADSIACDLLDQRTFRTFFREDVFVTNLFRNFLYACRLLGQFDIEPVCYPPIFKSGFKEIANHSLWDVWESIIESKIFLQQFKPSKKKKTPWVALQFFGRQMTAFEISLSSPAEESIKTSLQYIPALEQVLLSQSLRDHGLQLLVQYFSKGRLAVYSVLSVGVFRYILRLFRVICGKPNIFLISIFAKIISVDLSVQQDMMNNGEGGLDYFISKIDGDLIRDFKEANQSETALILFCLACATFNYPEAQELVIKLMPVYCMLLREGEVPGIVRNAALAILSLTDTTEGFDKFELNDGVSIVFSRIKPDLPVRLRLTLLALVCRFAKTQQAASVLVKFLSDPAPCIRRIVLCGLVTFGRTHSIKTANSGNAFYDRISQGIRQLMDDPNEQVAVAAYQFIKNDHMDLAVAYGPSEVIREAMDEVADAKCSPYWDDCDVLEKSGNAPSYPATHSQFDCIRALSCTTIDPLLRLSKMRAYSTTTNDSSPCRRVRFHTTLPWIAYSTTNNCYVEDMAGNAMLSQKQPANDFCFINDYIDLPSSERVPVFLSAHTNAKQRCDVMIYAIEGNELQQISGFSLFTDSNLTGNAATAFVDYGPTNYRLIVSVDSCSTIYDLVNECQIVTHVTDRSDPITATILIDHNLYAVGSLRGRVRLFDIRQRYVTAARAWNAADRVAQRALKCYDLELEGIHSVGDSGVVSVCMRSGKSLQVNPFTKPPSCTPAFQSSSKSLLAFSNRLEIASLEGRAVRLAGHVEASSIGGFVAEQSKKWRDKSPSSLGQTSVQVRGLYAHSMLPIVGIVTGEGCLSVYGNTERIGISPAEF